MRIDKWLWTARFYKTRSLASQAVESGKAELNGNHVKPAKDLHTGDMLTLRIGDAVWQIMVLGLSDKRGPAAVAALLYEEDTASRARRLELALERKLNRHPAADAKGRPTKKQRRELQRFTADE
jgi:ribosome-associated heat shock protein Hsp15